MNELKRGLTWGKGNNPLASAWAIVTNFVERVIAFFSDQVDFTEGEVEAEVASLAETVGDTEVAAAIEGAVLDELEAQGLFQIIWVAQPGACSLCRINANQGPIMLGDTFESGDIAPPAHPSCRCSISMADKGA